MKLTTQIRKKLRHYLALVSLYSRIWSLGFGKDDWFFFIDYGIGDTLFLCSLMKEFKRKNGGRIVLISRDSHEKIAKMFQDIDAYIPIDSKFKKLNSKAICSSRVIRKGKIFIPHPYSNSALFIMSEMIGYKDFNLFDMYRVILNLPVDSEMAQPDFSVHDTGPIKDFLYQNDCDPGKTVMLFPSANSIKSVGKDFWIELILCLVENGFKVIVNSESKEGFFNHRNVINVNMNLTATVALCLVVESVIASRSGICDLLAMGDKKITVLYPSVEAQKNLSLKAIFNKIKNSTELVIDESEDQKKTIKLLVSNCG